jgi:hypothetical protein
MTYKITTRAILFLAVFTIMSSALWGQGTEKEKEKKTDFAKPIDALSWLVGGVWTADTTRMGQGMQRIETRYQWSDNNSFLRFNTHFVFDKGTARTYDGNLFWSPAQNSLAIWYMDASNEIIEGSMQVQGPNWTVNFRGPDFEGKMADLQAEITRKSPDLYHWVVREKQADAWKEMMALDYHRVSGS